MERELALHVPAAARTAVARQMRAGQARRISLQARYFDTTTRELASAGIALRLRKEGRRWVQTLKAPGPDALSRVEINHLRSGPELDLSLYIGTPVEALLAKLSENLTLRYETRVTRLVSEAQVGEALIEVAYDQGSLLARDLELPISEVEFELKAGPMSALFDLSEQWLQAYGLLLEARSKSQRGDALAQAAVQSGGVARKPGDEHAPLALFNARRAQAIKLSGGMRLDEVYQACVTECLSQIVANTALAAGVDAEDASRQQQVEYVHQLRVGIRRLRSCWKLFQPWIPRPEAEIMNQLKTAFNLFGASRDDDVVTLEIAPKLAQAGMPELQPLAKSKKSAGTSAASVASSKELQTTLLRLLRHLIAMSETPPTAEADIRAEKALTQKLDEWVRKLAKEGGRFMRLPIEAQHDLRKKAKTLRYNLDFCEDLLPRRSLQSVRVDLAHIQDVLGDLNDYYVAQSCYERLVEQQPQAWFALGWLKAMQTQRQTQAQAAFKELRKLSLGKR
ncbi:CYTH and CHAD domain-containing protein [Pusillimonas sp. CC-YST705]|uniref:CYTH and CHAD domain-containing protein n=1 Tax=Mesopusillimonas faecipullorum TaxID=2755040 RepID=A0ABS8CBM7_9BURK|nr:CYTH and CHAD domain-containing protein [Mesopusillimonas faecipullorum]MCB5363436.1 CYTH and CHAD domain-containing protein [Mesopusillimonas faecipullorum]